MADSTQSSNITPSQEKQESRKHTNANLGVGVAGAIAGAALGAAAAVALSDEQRRKKVQKNMKFLRDKAIKVMDTLEKADEKGVISEKIHQANEAMHHVDTTVKNDSAKPDMK